MPGLAESTYGMIAEIVKSGIPIVTKMGTVASRDSTGPGATVALDGSSGTAQPVKSFESVFVRPGDRVGLVKYEGEWIITGNYTLRLLPDETIGSAALTSGTTSSITFVDMPGSPSLNGLIKLRDNTTLRISVMCGLRVSAGVGIEIGVRIVSLDGVTNYDQGLCRRIINTVNSHEDVGGWVDTTALASGSYSFTMRWRRASGSTEVLTVDANDAVSLRVQEVQA